MNNRIAIITPEKRHVAELAEFCQKTFTDAYRVTLPEKELQTYVEQTFAAERLRAEIQSPLCCYRLAVNPDGRICAYIKCIPSPSPSCVTGRGLVELQRFYVGPGCTGKGTGGRLLTSGEQAMAEKGYATIWLRVWEGNLQAQQMYLKRSYTFCGEEMYRVGREARKVLLMSKRLLNG